MFQLPPVPPAPLPPPWYYDEGAASTSDNPSSSELLVSSYVFMNDDIRGSTNTAPHTIPWTMSLQHPQATESVSQTSFPGLDTLESSSSYGPSSSIQQAQNLHTTRQRKMPYLLWENNKEEMKRFYMDEDRTLPELIEHMKTLGFKATKRQYKDQFKKWKWSKNLTGDIAVFMRGKATQRKKQNPPKDTVFHWHGKNWTTDQVLRDGNVGGDIAVEHATPHDLSYQTPCQPNMDEPSVQPAYSNVSSVQNTSREAPGIQLRWNGYNAADIEVLLDKAFRLEQEKDIVGAEENFNLALDACYHLYPPAHEFTISITYRVAIFYGKQYNMVMADLVLDQLTKQIISQWGRRHETTIKHYLIIASFLEAWDRHDDFIRVITQLTHGSNGLLINRESNGEEHRVIIDVDNQTVQSSAGLSNIEVDICAFSPQQILSEIEKDNPCITDVDTGRRLSLEDMVERLIEKLMKSPKDHMVDIIRAQTALVKLHNKSDPAKKDAVFREARKSALLLCRLPCKKGLTFCQTAIDFVAECLKLWYQHEAMEILEAIEEVAAEETEPEDPDLISLMIRIGKMLQDKTTWKEAAPRFEQAYAARISAFGHDSNVTRRLESSLEECRYSSNIELEGQSGVLKAVYL